MRTFYIETVGCQMNELDSELVVGSLIDAGYQRVESAKQADTILFNTCSVRQHAEDKIYSALGRLKHVKRSRPHTVIGVLGCMAQKDQELIAKRAPHVDLVVGPGQIGRVAELVGRAAERNEASPPRPPADRKRLPGKETPPPPPLMEVSLGRSDGKLMEIKRSFTSFDPQRSATTRNATHQAHVRIMFGCDKFCTYCIVPAVRGPEQSRPADDVVLEARQLVDQGCKEITLIGQTVNSYRDISKQPTTRLSDLLARLDTIPGLLRIKFVTNYPRHMTDDLLEAVRDLPKVSPYLHVPAQSGNNDVLQRMKRGYTIEQYRDMMHRIWNTVPGAAVTSDFIVGFCGETDDEFQQTVDLVRWARFKNSFIFKYSTRPGTKSAELLEDDVPEDVKRRRNNELLAVQNAICQEDNQRFVGRDVEILVEGPSKAARKQLDRQNGNDGRERSADDVSTLVDERSIQLTGRTTCDRIVVFDGPMALAGNLINVNIHEANAFTLFGQQSSRGLDRSGGIAEAV